MSTRKESDLYAPVKAFLEAQGYAVRGEVHDCDLVAVRGEQVLVVELKAAFNLALVLQGIARQRLTDNVYVAVEAPRTQRSEPRWTEVRELCRRLGLGLLAVLFFERKSPLVQVVCDPEPYTPRRSPKKRTLLLKEFHRRTGDHNTGGVTRRPIVTAYREEALRVALYLREHGPSAPKAVAGATALAKAAAFLQKDYYGWFERVAKGIYQLTPKGEQALTLYADVVADH
ncbi:MAG: hypothetical protein JWN15_3762 [Firmicutes bacterium]|nr:hypothetical protein [Bacillota bacterium]